MVIIIASHAMRAGSSKYQYGFVAGNLALDFVNTVAYRADPEKMKDHLTTAEEARQWANQAGLPDCHAINSCSPMNHAALRRLRVARQDLFAIFHAIAMGRPISTAALKRVGKALQDSRAKQSLDREGKEVRWTWSRGASCADFLLYPVLKAAIDLLTSASHGLVRQCAGEGCGWLFLDRSNAGRRRWCSMADCGNRNKARRHYQRGMRLRKDPFFSRRRGS